MNVLRSCETLWWDGVEEIVEEEDFCVWLRLRWMITIRRTSSSFLQRIRQFHRFSIGIGSRSVGKTGLISFWGGLGVLQWALHRFSRGVLRGFSGVLQGSRNEHVGRQCKARRRCWGSVLFWEPIEPTSISLTWVPYRVLLLSATPSNWFYLTWA